MQLLRSRTAMELALLQVAMNLVSGIFIPFFPVWFAAKGFDPSAIGYALAAAMVLRSISSPIAGLVADARDDRRSVIFAMSGVSIIAWSLAGASPWLNFVFMFAVLGSVAYSTSGPIVESITLRRAQSEGFNYGHVRLCGSSAYVVANILSGYAVASLGVDVFVPWVVISVGLAIFAAALLPGRPVRHETSFRKSFVRTWEQAKLLARHRIFILFVLAGSLIQAAHAFYYGYFTLTYEAVGLSKETIGWLWGLGVVGEVVLFAFAQRAFTYVGAVPLMMIGAIGSLLRWTITAFVPPLSVLLFVQLLHAASFGATHLGSMLFILRATPGSLSSTAQSFYAVVSYGLMMALATLLSGLLYETIGSYGFLAMSLLALAGLGLTLLLGRLWKGELLDLGGAVPQYAPSASPSEER